MSALKATPGPWLIKQLFGTDGFAIMRSEGARVRRVDDRGTFSREDARLIAAAPELYEALASLCDSIEREEDLNGSLSGVLMSDMRAGLAALAKARGETA